MAKANVKPTAEANAQANARNKKKQLAQLDSSTPEPIAVQKTVKMARGLAVDGESIGALQAMAEAFDGLDDAEGVDPWEPGVLLGWSASQPRDIQHAVLFVLGLADPKIEFRIHAAMQEWDDMARLAFTSWALKPWWVSEAG